MNDDLKKPAPLRIFKDTKSKKDTKTLRQNILHPLLIATSIISIIMIVFFNIIFWIMLYSGVVHDLNAISALIEQVEVANDEKENTPKEMIDLYNGELERYSVSYRSNLVFLNTDGKITTSANGFQSNEKESIEAKADELIVDNSITGLHQIRISKDILIVMPLNIESNDGSHALIYASIRSLWSAVKWGNRAILVIIIISFLAFLIASNIISRNISKPIKELSEQMEVVGDGNFSPVNITDNSEEMQNLTNSINEMLARLQAYHNAHTRSIQNLSHDLKTPLMSISGYAEGIKYGVLNDTQEAADVIINESKRLTGVVEKILMLSDLDALHTPISMGFINLTSFLDDEVKSLDGYALKENVNVACDCENEITKVLADPELLSTIVRNLLSNAIRYAKQTVDIKTFEKDDIIYLCVCDDGDGLSKEDMKYLFVRNYVGKTGHTGLGLAASKSAAEYMGCGIEGTNRNPPPADSPCYNDCGAIFTVKFYRTEN